MNDRKNYAEFFPILKYKDGKLTRVNGNKRIIAGSYTKFPIFSTMQRSDFDLNLDVRINGGSVSKALYSIETDGKFLKDVPDPCFLVAVRYAGGYTIEEVESLNKIWDKLMLELKNEYWN